MDKFIETYGDRPNGFGELAAMTTRAQDIWDALRAAYEIGKSEEREACANVCEQRAEGWKSAQPARDESYALCQHGARNEARALGIAIRMRSYTK